MTDGSGGAVRAAISAGERICLAASQPTAEATTTAANPIPRVVFRPIFVPSRRTQTAGPSGSLSHRRHQALNIASNVPSGY